MSRAPKAYAASALWLLPLVVAAVCSVYAFDWLLEQGLTISRDGAHYLEVAFDIHLDGFRLGDPAYPVGFSALVALAMFLEPFPVDAAALVGGTCYALALCFSADLFRRASGSATLAAVSVLALATLPAFWSNFLHVLSEPPFCALVVLHTWCVARYAERSDASYGWLVAAAVAVGLAGVVRTIAYAVLLVFTLYVLWCAFERRREPRELLRLAFAHMLSWLPIAIIGLVRKASGVEVHGARGESSEPLALNLERAAAAIPADLGIFLLSALAISAGLLAWRVLQTLRSSPLRDEERGTRWIALYALALVGVYVAAIIAAATLTRISPVGTRFFAPYYPLFVALACSAASLAPRAARRVVLAALGIGFASLIVSNLRAVEGLEREAERFASADFVPHYQLGFDRNPATAELRAFLRELAAQPERVHIGVISPLPSGGQHPAMARTLMFRSSSLAPDGAVDFERLETGQFVIRTASTPAGGGLRYHDLPLTGWHDASARSVHLALSREMGAADWREHWLLALSFADPLFGAGAIPGSPLHVAESREVGAYRAHRLVWTAAAPTE